MAKMSRDKGKRGELEVAALLKRFGFEARRGQQFSGGGDSPDVIHNLPCGFHIEVKRVERFNVYEALRQAEEDCAGELDNLVFHRRNDQYWIVVLDAEKFLHIMQQIAEIKNGQA